MKPSKPRSWTLTPLVHELVPLGAIVEGPSFERGERVVEFSALTERDEVIEELLGALERYENDLIEGGAYIVEPEFEEPEHCARLRETMTLLTKARERLRGMT